MVTNKSLLIVWRAMHNRCYCAGVKSYRDYGGRGIFVEQCWHGKQGFLQFLQDMGPRPDGASIERRNNDAAYGPSNCRWASRLEQSRNKRNSRHITVKGERLTLAEWAERLGCSHSAIIGRIRRGMTEEEAVTTPVPARPNSKMLESDVRLIRDSYPRLSAASLAATIGVSKKTVLNVLHGKTFKDIKE